MTPQRCASGVKTQTGREGCHMEVDFQLCSTVWSTGVQSYWRQLDASVDHAELSHLRAKRAAIFIYQFMLTSLVAWVTVKHLSKADLGSILRNIP